MNLKDALTDWKIEYGEEKTAKSGSTYYVIPQLSRKELLVVLVGLLLEKGLDSRKKYNDRIKRQIAEACVWVDGPDRSKTKNKMAAVIATDLPYALNQVFAEIEAKDKISDIDEDSEETSAEPEAFTAKEIQQAVAKLPEFEPASSDQVENEDEPGMTEAAKKLMKPFDVEKALAERSGTRDGLDTSLLDEMGIDPKEFGWSK